MAKYGFTTTIPYGKDLFEVTGMEYCQWEDALESVDETDTNAADWATYDVLMNNGYLVSQPKEGRPVIGKTIETKAEGKTKVKGKAKAKATVNPVLDIDTTGFGIVSGETREPAWTPSRILAERTRLLKEREVIAKLKDNALTRKIQNFRDEQRQVANPTNVYNDGSEAFYTAVGVIVVLVILFLGFSMK